MGIPPLGTGKLTDLISIEDDMRACGSKGDPRHLPAVTFFLRQRRPRPSLPFSAAGTRLAADTVAAVRLSDRGHDVFEIRLEIGLQSSGSDRLVHLQPQGLYAFIRGDVVGQADHLIERHV